MEDFNSAKAYALHDIGVYIYNNFNKKEIKYIIKPSHLNKSRSIFRKNKKLKTDIINKKIAHNRLFNKKDIENIRYMYHNKKSITYISIIYNTSHSVISNIVNNKTYKNK